MHYCLITILAVFIGISTINAQDGRQGKKVFALGMHAYYGFILKHTESIGHLAQSHPYALEFNLNRITDGSKVAQGIPLPGSGIRHGILRFQKPYSGKSDVCPHLSG